MNPPDIRMRVQHRPHERRAGSGHSPNENQGHLPVVLVTLVIRTDHELLLRVHLAGHLLRQAEHAQAEEDGGDAEQEEAADDGPPGAAAVQTERHVERFRSCRRRGNRRVLRVRRGHFCNRVKRY